MDDVKRDVGEIYLFSYGCNGLEILAKRTDNTYDEIRRRSYGAVVQGYSRAFAGIKSRNWGDGAVATLIEGNENAETQGTATLLTPEEIAKVDTFEAWPYHYRYQRLTVHVCQEHGDGSYALVPKPGFAYVQTHTATFAPPSVKYLCAIAANIGAWFSQPVDIPLQRDECALGYVTVDVRNAVDGSLHSTVTFLRTHGQGEWVMLRPHAYHLTRR